MTGRGWSGLEQNIIDVIREEQIKLGYRSELVRLYYPLSSLNRFAGEECSEQEMRERLKDFCDQARPLLGEIGVTSKNGRFCLAIPPQGVDYVHEHMEGTEFIQDFIHTIERHGCTLEDILQQFHRYSDHVHVQKMDNGEFDYLIYFEDGVPDDFRYCITLEECHAIYHRFTPGDYEDFGF